MGIIFGLVAAFGWGTADFLVRFSARMIGTYRTLFFIQFLGIVVLGIYLIGTGQLVALLSSTSWQPWAWAVLAILLSILGSLTLYRSYEIGVLMVVAPITSCYAAVTSALAFLTGEVVSQVHIAGLVVALAGVVLVATPLGSAFARRKDRVRGGLPPGVLWAIVASLSYGVSFWILGFYVNHALGAITTTWLTRLLTSSLLAACAPLVGQPLKLPRGRVWWYIGAIGIIDTIAFIAYNIGLTVAQISVVSVISSLYSAVTVVLAWIILRERLQLSQWCGIGVVFAGLVLVNI
jgi:drug/metabolite transporter (DMT)-like permease